MPRHSKRLLLPKLLEVAAGVAGLKGQEVGEKGELAAGRSLGPQPAHLSGRKAAPARLGEARSLGDTSPCPGEGGESDSGAGDMLC